MLPLWKFKRQKSWTTEIIRTMSQSDSYRTPTIDRATPLPDIGDKRFSGERFFSRDFMDREWTHLWRRTWNMGPRIEELTQVGDYVIHNLGKESFIFVMSEEGVIQGTSGFSSALSTAGPGT